MLKAACCLSSLRASKCSFAQSTAVFVQTRTPSHFRCDGCCNRCCACIAYKRCMPALTGSARTRNRKRAVCTKQLVCLCKRVSRRTSGATGAATLGICAASGFRVHAEPRASKCGTSQQRTHRLQAMRARLHKALLQKCLYKRVTLRTLGAQGAAICRRLRCERVPRARGTANQQTR